MSNSSHTKNPAVNVGDGVVDNLPLRGDAPELDGLRARVVQEARLLWDVGRPRRPIIEAHQSTLARPEGAIRHCVLLHGWHSTERQMRAWQRALQELPEAEGVHFWRVSYDTHWKSFQRSARQVMQELRRRDSDWSDTLLIGYSMGGIVARQMVAYGFPCQSLIALCSPHNGAMAWSPLRFPLAGDPGAGTLVSWSPKLRALNNNPRDRAHRSRYHFRAITFSDRRGFHDNDGIVGRPSAMAEALGPVASRAITHFHYQQKPEFFTDPHMGGMSPRSLPEVAELCREIFIGKAPAPPTSHEETVIEAAPPQNASFDGVASI